MNTACAREGGERAEGIAGHVGLFVCRGGCDVNG